MESVSFVPFFVRLKEITPKTVPIIDAKNNVSKVFTVPNTRPITKNNLISPPPMPPFDTSAMKNNRPNPTTAPTNTIPPRTKWREKPN